MSPAFSLLWGAANMNGPPTGQRARALGRGRGGVNPSPRIGGDWFRMMRTSSGKLSTRSEAKGLGGLNTAKYLKTCIRIAFLGPKKPQEEAKNGLSWVFAPPEAPNMPPKLQFGRFHATSEASWSNLATTWPTIARKMAIWIQFGSHFAALMPREGGGPL